MKNMKSFQNILNAVERAKQGGSTYDADKDRTYMPTKDRAGNGFALIRFLPAKTDDDLPFVKSYNHGFKGPLGKWFIEDCPTTIGGQCPCCEANNVLWNSGVEADKNTARDRKRKVSYHSNILVISDPKNPENEGKVFLFRYGQKIFDKIMDKLSPPKDEKGNLVDPDDEPVNVFDPEEGANFKMKIRQVEGYANYDKSEFEKPSAIEGDVKAMLKEMTDLNKFVDPTRFKSYAELSDKLGKILGNSATVARPSVDEDDEPVVAKKAAPKVAPKKVEAEDDDDDLSYFKSLAEAD